MNRWILVVLVCIILSSVVEGVYIDPKVQEILDARVPEQARGIRVFQTSADESVPDLDVIVVLKDGKLNSVGNLVSENNINRVLPKESIFSGFLTLDEIDSLISSDFIESIYYNEKIYLDLAESVPLIKADSVWNFEINGSPLTGTGQTVCVIDNGVDFSHPDLVNKNVTCNVDCFGKDCIKDCSFAPVNGHGTHVAGIIGANGILKGVAPDVNILGINVFEMEAVNPGASLLDIREAIRWCINDQRVSDYNISVISLSLGSGNHTSYCDGHYLENVINEATSKNISVVIATGNDGFNDRVAAPACVRNAIRVGSSNNTDGVSYFSNIWESSMLMAPGSMIWSTKAVNTPQGFCSDSGNYRRCSGTSMATPHVSGAIAIINQYLQLRNKSMTPKEIEELLYNTGISINEPTTGLTFSRINVLASLQQLQSAPIVYLDAPPDLTVTSPNVIFACSATSFYNLTSAELFVWNESDVHLTNTTVLSETEAFVEFNQTLEDGRYTWNCKFSNNKDNEAFAENNFTLFIDTQPPNITILNPINGSFYNTTNISLNISVVDALSNISSCWYVLNESQGNISNCKDILLTDLVNAEYFLEVFANDTLGNTNSTNMIFTVDTLLPTIEIISPTDQIYSNESLLINISANDTHLDSIWFVYNDTVYENLIEYNFTEGFHTIVAYANDSAGNVNSTAVTFGVDLNPPLLVQDLVISPVLYEDNKTYIFSVRWFDIGGIDTAYLVFNDTNHTMIYLNGIFSHNVTNLSLGNHTYAFWANDTFGRETLSKNFTLEIFTINNTTVIAENESLDLNSTITTLILPRNSPLKNISIQNRTNLNLSFVKENNLAVISNTILVNASNDLLLLYENTTIAGTDWDSIFLLPYITTSENLSLSAQSIDRVMKIGSEQQLNFSKPVQLVFSGMKNKRAAWTSGFTGSLTPISTICSSADDPAIVPCYRTVGDDLIIWTMHASTYVAYTPTPPPVQTSGGGGGSSSSAAAAPPRDITRGIVIPFFNTASGVLTNEFPLFDSFLQGIRFIPTNNESRAEIFIRKISNSSFEIQTNTSFDVILVAINASTDYILVSDDLDFSIELKDDIPHAFLYTTGIFSLSPKPVIEESLEEIEVRNETPISREFRTQEYVSQEVRGNSWWVLVLITLIVLFGLGFLLKPRRTRIYIRSPKEVIRTLDKMSKRK